nr:MAG TPA: hypothetical protein [Caudoviricetes sp.]
MRFITNKLDDYADGAWISRFVEWQFDEFETFESISIEGSELPKGISTSNNSTSFRFEGHTELVDLYHSIAKSYIRSGFKLEGNEWRFLNESPLVRLTLEDFVKQLMHYTGKSYHSKGIRGLWHDGLFVSFHLNITVNYIYEYIPDEPKTGFKSQKIKKSESKIYYFNAYPSFSPAYFCKLYVTQNGGTLIDGSKTDSYDVWAANMKANGFGFLTY